MTANRAELRHLVQGVETWSPPKEAPDDPFVYVDLSSVDRELKEITAPQGMTGAEAPSRARQLLQSGDVLVSTVRPNLNAVARVPDDLDGATGSTGFCVLRPDPDVLDSGYLFHWTRNPSFVAAMVRRATGANYPAVSDRIVKESRIPLPPLPEQRRIAAILDKTGAIRRKRQQTLDLADQFLRSAFLDLFGDPVTNPKGWPVIEFGELLSDISYGTSKKCTSERTVGTTPILRIPNILGGEISWDDLKHCALDARELDKLRLEDGDLLFVRTNGNPEYIARCAVFDGNDEPVAFASYLIRARFREGADALPVFLREQFSFPTYRSRLVRETRTTAGNFNISSKGLRRLRLVLPPMREQEQFFRAIEAIVRLRKKYATAQTSEEALLGSVTQRAFRGELSAPVGGKP